MFKFLKGQPRKTTEQIIADIHNEFDSASEKILNEAKTILSLKSSDKGDRLQKLGFQNSKPAKDAEEAIMAAKKASELAERVAYFSQWYPFNKFITEEAIETICKKYGLVFGDAFYYKGDVPEKNLREMESFVLRNEDMNKKTRLDSMMEMRMFQSAMQNRFDSFGVPIPSGRLLGFPKEEMTKASEEVTYTKPPFKICAPENDFDKTYLSRRGHKLELNIPDPIVLQPVKGGYLIVTKWGLEASDELVKNDTMN